MFIFIQCLFSDTGCSVILRAVIKLLSLEVIHTADSNDFTNSAILFTTFKHLFTTCQFPWLTVCFLYTTVTKALLPCESEIGTKMDRNQPISSRESC